MRKDSDTKKGFTIIEVSLVIAIAGLIFLMVFVALPSLQRLTRDSQRKEDITQLMNFIKKYQQNNRGTLPSGGGNSISYSTGSASQTSWQGFYNHYLGENFLDPTGERYRLNIGTLDDDTSNFVYPGNSMDYTLYIRISAKCEGEQAVKTENPRRVAIVYRLEGSGVFCDDM